MIDPHLKFGVGFFSHALGQMARKRMAGQKISDPVKNKFVGLRALAPDVIYWGWI
jgi:hypothetical protein